MLVYEDVVSRYFWRIAIITAVLPNRNSKIKRVIVRIAKANTILKRPINKFFTVRNTHHDTNQADKGREKKLRREAAVIGELKIKYIC